MKQNSFSKFSDKLFAIVTGTMCILFIFSFIQNVLGYNGIVNDATIWYCRIIYSIPMVVFFAAVTVLAQLLFVASRFKDIGYDNGDKFLITILILSIVTEFFWIPFCNYLAFLRWPIYIFVLAAAMAIIALIVQLWLIASCLKKLRSSLESRFIIVVLLLSVILEFLFIPMACALDIQDIFYLWIPPVLFLVQVTKKDFGKASDKILTVTTWIMTSISVLSFVMFIFSSYSNFEPELYSFIFLAKPVIMFFGGVIIASLVLFMVAYSKELKGSEGAGFKAAIILSIFAMFFFMSHFEIYQTDKEEPMLFYFCIPPFLILVESVKKRFFKVKEK